MVAYVIDRWWKETESAYRDACETLTAEVFGTLSAKYAQARAPVERGNDHWNMMNGMIRLRTLRVLGVSKSGANGTSIGNASHNHGFGNFPRLNLPALCPPPVRCGKESRDSHNQGFGALRCVSRDSMITMPIMANMRPQGMRSASACGCC
jgi:hypothetical protein